MQRRMKVGRQPSPVKWFILAAVLGGLFLLYTAIYATGALNMSTLVVERWLLNRSIGRIDCSLFEWRRLGEAPFTLVFTALLGLICWRAGFRRRVIVIMLLLVVLCVGVEVVGKKMFDLPLPPVLRSGMVGLTCPQLDKQPLSVQVSAGLGLLGNVPPPPPKMVNWTHTVATMPFVFQPGASENSYPGGHAMRWCFVCFIASWLCWALIRRRFLRGLLTAFFFVFAFAGGVIQFYIGVHFLTDTISGYLFGAAAACCAIGFLILNDTRYLRAPTRQAGPLLRGYRSQDIGSYPTLPEHSTPGRQRTF